MCNISEKKKSYSKLASHADLPTISLMGPTYFGELHHEFSTGRGLNRFKQYRTNLIERCRGLFDDKITQKPYSLLDCEDMPTCWLPRCIRPNLLQVSKPKIQTLRLFSNIIKQFDYCK